ncbi:MAG: hypothetical protein IJ897_00555 [Prevotella sp.]|nr:hypothetical protein [Prevotella sp.]
MIKDHGQSIRSKLLNISKAEKQEYMVLQEAIRNTFANRNTTYSENKHLFDSIYLTRLLLTMRNETRIGGHFS